MSRIPKSKRINYDDDLVRVYDDKKQMVYQGILDDCPYKYEDYKWSEKDHCYLLPHGYKMIGL